MGCAAEFCSEARLNFGQIPLPGDQRLRRFPELFLNCLLHDIQKVTGNRGGVSCHCTPKLVLRRSSSARIRICGPVGCRKTCCVWLRQCPRSLLNGKGVPDGECSPARDCVAPAESQRELNILGARRVGRLLFLIAVSGADFPAGPNHTSVAALILFMKS